MNNIFKSKEQKSKTRYLFGFEAYSKVSTIERIFDDCAEYNNCFFINEMISYSFFGLPVYKIIRSHDVKKHFLCGVNIRTYDLIEFQCKTKLNNINSDFDDAYILAGGSGEVFQWILAAKAEFSKNGSKKPLVIGTRTSFNELLKMYLPDVSYIADRRLCAFDTEGSYMEYAGHKFYRICYCPKNLTYLILKNLYIPYIYDVVRELELYGVKKDDVSCLMPAITNETKDSLKKKISGLGLDLDNFVILATEAGWATKPQLEFWKLVAQKFKGLGIDVFQNYINQNNFLADCKSSSEPLTYSEIFELASKAKAVISLRSGFTETILPTLTPIIVILTPGMHYFPKPANRNEDPLYEFPYVKKDSIKGVWYFDYDTNEEAADAVISYYQSIIKAVYTN